MIARLEISIIQQYFIKAFEGFICQTYGEGFLGSRSDITHRGDETHLVSMDLAVGYLLAGQEGKLVKMTSSKVKDFYSITVEEVKEVFRSWSIAQGRNGNELDIICWLEEACHYFPSPENISEELETSIKAVQREKLHPIEKACRIWYDIVRIHISHEANKRSGKALGSIILLSNGYLPPKIGKESTEEYVKLLSDGFEQDDGFERFVSFIAGKITETHAVYADQISEHKLCSNELPIKACWALLVLCFSVLLTHYYLWQND